MATATKPPLTKRIALDREHTLEVTRTDTGDILLYTADETRDVALILSTSAAGELHAELARLLRSAPSDSRPGIRSEQGRRILEHFRAALIALGEHDKTSGHEGDEIARALIEHIKSSRAYVLREVAK